MGRKVKIIEDGTNHRGVITENEYNRQLSQLAGETVSLARRFAGTMTKGKKRATYTYGTSGKKQSKWHKSGQIERKLKNNIRYYIKSRNNDISGIIIQFPLHGIFREYGVGNGSPIGMVKRSIVTWLTSALRMEEDSLDYIVGIKADEAVWNIFTGQGHLKR